MSGKRFIREMRNERSVAGVTAGLRDLYVQALLDPLPEEWFGLAERFADKQARSTSPNYNKGHSQSPA
jgi:hypothetical protein